MNKKLVLLLLVATLLSSFQGFSQLPDPQIDGPHPDVKKPFFIKIYYNFLVAPSSSLKQVDADARAAASLIHLNNVYNQHNIFFTSKNGSCSTAFSDIFSVPSPLTVENARNNIAGTVHSDGLDIYVIEDSGGAAGNAFALPNNFCEVRGSTSGVWAEESEVIIHEIGHCLGLSHTFSGSGACLQIDATTCACACSEEEIGYCCGDYVADTEFNSYTGSINANPITCEPISVVSG